MVRLVERNDFQAANVLRCDFGIPHYAFGAGQCIPRSLMRCYLYASLAGSAGWRKRKASLPFQKTVLSSCYKITNQGINMMRVRIQEVSVYI